MTTSGGPDHLAALEAERAVNERYLREMADMLKRHAKSLGNRPLFEANSGQIQPPE